MEIKTSLDGAESQPIVGAENSLPLALCLHNLLLLVVIHCCPLPQASLWEFPGALCMVLIVGGENPKKVCSL